MARRLGKWHGTPDLESPFDCIRAWSLSEEDEVRQAAGDKLLDPTFDPFAEIAADGSSVIGKHEGTGGAVSVGTVTSQLLYEIGGPEYLGPDVTTRFDTIELEPQGPDRVRIHGTRGQPPPATLKVCINRPAGFRNDMSICLTGMDIEAKAKLVEDGFWAACPYAPEDFAYVSTRLVRTDREDPETTSRPWPS